MVMDTGKKLYCRYIYELVPTKFTSYELYKLVELQGKTKHLTNFIKFEQNAKKNNGYRFDVWLRIEETENFNDHTLITGLRSTNKSNVFTGNRRTMEKGKFKPQSLIIFQFLNEGKTVVVDFFNNYYINNPFLLRHLINNHAYAKQKKGA